MSKSETPDKVVAILHLRDGVTLPGFYGGQTSWGADKTPHALMTHVRGGVYIEAKNKTLTATAFIPESNIKIMVYE